MKKLDLSFYQNDDFISIGKNLLGKFLFSKIDDIVCGGMIVETESYGGAKDKACHAYNNRYTKRTRPMYEKGGITYIYICYGMHNLLNVVTGKQNTPTAILIRAIEPTCNIEIMKKRTNSTKISCGPALVCKALKITKKQNEIKLNSNIIWIEDRNVLVKEIIQSPRVGISYAQEHALLPWRFRIKNNRWTTKPK